VNGASRKYPKAIPSRKKKVTQKIAPRELFNSFGERAGLQSARIPRNIGKGYNKTSHKKLLLILDMNCEPKVVVCNLRLSIDCMQSAFADMYSTTKPA